MNDVVSNTALLHDPDFDAPEPLPVIDQQTCVVRGDQPFSWMAILSQVPARPAFFLGFGLAVMIVTTLGFFVVLSILWNV